MKKIVLTPRSFSKIPIEADVITPDNFEEFEVPGKIALSLTYFAGATKRLHSLYCGKHPTVGWFIVIVASIEGNLQELEYSVYYADGLNVV